MKLKSIFAVVAMAICAGQAGAVGTLIPAPAAKDMVFDALRKVIYITNATQVLRYDVATGKFLAPITLGGDLFGVDLSPDGTTLAVGDATTMTVNSKQSIFVHRVNLSSLVDNKASFPLSPSLSGSGTWAVAYGVNGDLLASESLNGSGFVEVLDYTASTNTWSILSPIMQSTMFSTSGDGRVIVFAEPDNSGGPFDFFNDLSNVLTRHQSGGFIFDVASNLSGYQIAIFSGNSAEVYTNGTSGPSIPGVGGVYDPIRPIAYFPQPNSSKVVAYNMTTFAPVTDYNFNTTFQHSGVFGFGNGRARISLDGSQLMAIGNDGVHYLQLYAPLKAAPVAATTAAGKSVAITAAGSIGISTTLTYALLRKPAHGTATVKGNVVTYVPASGFSGTDTFSYQALYGRAYANATMSVTVQPAGSALDGSALVGSALVATDRILTVHQRTPVMVPVLANCHGGDGLSLRVVAVKQPQHGNAAIQGDQILYTPPDARNSSETIEYTVSDGHGRMATGHATIRVINAN